MKNFRVHPAHWLISTQVVVFGGVNAKQFLGDLHVLYAPARIWSAPRLAGPAVAPRMRPALVVASWGPEDGADTATLYIFGGTRAWGAAAAVATAMPIPASVISTGPRFQRSSLPSSSRAAEATKST